MARVHPLSPLATTGGDQTLAPATSSQQQQSQRPQHQSVPPNDRDSTSSHQEQSETPPPTNTTPTDVVMNEHHTSATKNLSSSPSRNSIISNNSNGNNNGVVPSEMDFLQITPQKSKSFDQNLPAVSTHSYDTDDDSYSWQEDLLFENRQRPSNERLLCTAFLSFFSFALLQTFAAIIAGSEAMMGDSAAMMVDALTYLFNLVAERRKNSYKSALEGLHNQHKKHKRQRRRQYYNRQSRKAIEYEQQQQLDDLQLEIHECNCKSKTLRLELIPPLISVSALLVVTVVVAKEAIQVLSLHFDGAFDVMNIVVDDDNTTENTTATMGDDNHDDRLFRILKYDEASKIVISESTGSKTDPNIHLMMLFSVLNLLLDSLNVFCFAKADHATGYATTDHHSSHATTTIEFMNHNNQSQRRAKTQRNNPKIESTLNMGAPEASKATRSVDLLSQDVEEIAASNSAVQATTTDLLGQDAQPQNQAETFPTENNSTPTSRNLNGEFRANVNEAHPERQEEEEQQPQPHPGTPKRKPLIPFEIEDPINDIVDNDDDTKEGDANLNMCSAYTHVFADTLRSAAVIIAAVISEFVDAVTPELADASAALIVSVLIFLSLFPLFTGMVQTIRSLRETGVTRRRAAKRLGRLEQHLLVGEDGAVAGSEDPDDDEEEGLLQADYTSPVMGGAR